MSALAQVYAARGCKITGSDRLLDNGLTNLPLWEILKQAAVEFFPQNASGVTKDLDAVILSGAIDAANPDFTEAKKLGLKILHRSQALSQIISGYKVIAVTGTSGKSTTTAMIFEILQYAELSPSLITGGPLISLMEKGLVGNFFMGKSDIMVIEADESDGSFVNYHPEIAVMLNLTKDHKDLNTLENYFGAFRKNCKKFITNADRENLTCFTPDKTFGLTCGGTKAENIELSAFGSRFDIKNVGFEINLCGIHNVSNATAAVSVCLEMGVSLEKCTKALEKFKGVYRRFNSIGKIGSIEVIDDFAHNPEKIKASIKAAGLRGKRVLAFYQPHGYLPMKIYGADLTCTFSDALRENDILWLCDVYGATNVKGGENLVERIYKPLKLKGRNVFYIPDKKDIISEITTNARTGDVVLIMGARDPLLNDYSHRVLEEIKQKVQIKSRL